MHEFQTAVWMEAARDVPSEASRQLVLSGPIRVLVAHSLCPQLSCTMHAWTFGEMAAEVVSVATTHEFCQDLASGRYLPTSFWVGKELTVDTFSLNFRGLEALDRCQQLPEGGQYIAKARWRRSYVHSIQHDRGRRRLPVRERSVALLTSGVPRACDFEREKKTFVEFFHQFSWHGHKFSWAVWTSTDPRSPVAVHRHWQFSSDNGLLATTFRVSSTSMWPTSVEFTILIPFLLPFLLSFVILRVCVAFSCGGGGLRVVWWWTSTRSALRNEVFVVARGTSGAWWKCTCARCECLFWELSYGCHGALCHCGIADGEPKFWDSTKPLNRAVSLSLWTSLFLPNCHSMKVPSCHTHIHNITCIPDSRQEHQS